MMTAEIETTARRTTPGGWVAAELAKLKPRFAVSTEEFEIWMAAEQQRVYLLCLRFLRNSEDADSAAQDTFLKAYRALQKRPSESIEAPEKWLTRIAVNTCLDLLRSRRWKFWRRSVSHGNDETLLALMQAPEPTPENKLLSRDVTRRISLALSKLSPRQRSVFILRHEEDLSLEEIGEFLGLDIGTVKAHMSRALQKLREELQDLYGKPTLE